jgi:hypothetical protein
MYANVGRSFCVMYINSFSKLTRTFETNITIFLLMHVYVGMYIILCDVDSFSQLKNIWNLLYDPYSLGKFTAVWMAFVFGPIHTYITVQGKPLILSIPLYANTYIGIVLHIFSSNLCMES